MSDPNDFQRTASASFDLLAVCANCGEPRSSADSCISGDDGEFFCSAWCFDYHEEHGCPGEVAPGEAGRRQGLRDLSAFDRVAGRVLSGQSITEPTNLYICEFIYQRPDELPAPHNRPEGIRIMKRRSNRSRPASQRLEAANLPGMLSWSTTENVRDIDLINWALSCWASLASGSDSGWSHCTKIEIEAAP